MQRGVRRAKRTVSLRETRRELYVNDMRWIAIFLMLTASACSHSPPRDYYRERALVNMDSATSTYSIEKRELGPNPYGIHSAIAAEANTPVTDAGSIRAALTLGNDRFANDTAVHPRQDKKRRKEISSAQHPHTAVLSCSDSRVPPEELFDQGLGDLFVVRTAGEVADSSAIASLEYAVEHAGVKALLILGHTSCGAVKATLSTPKGTSAGSKDLDKLIDSIRPHLKGFELGSAGPDLEYASRAQVDGVADDLLKRSKIIREAVDKHGLQLLVGIYRLDSGRVEFWPPSTRSTPQRLGK